MVISSGTGISACRTITSNSLFLGMIDPLAVGRHMWVTTMRQQNIFPGQRPAKIVCIHIGIFPVSGKRTIRSHKNKILKTLGGDLSDKLLSRNGTVGREHHFKHLTGFRLCVIEGFRVTVRVISP